jgi:hypothetical protein
VLEGVDAVAEGTGYVAGATAERMSEAQEAAARAGEKSESCQARRYAATSVTLLLLIRVCLC